MEISYDVTFAPMTNVTIEVHDPLNLTEEEEEMIIEAARKNILTVPGEYITEENLESIEQYNKKTRKKTIVFADDRLHLTDKQLETLRDIFHEYKDYNRHYRKDILQAMELEKIFFEISGGNYEADTTYDIKGSKK